MENPLESIKVSLSNDKMEAYIDIPEPLEGKTITKEEVFSLLEEKGVTFGVHKDVIEQLVDEDKDISLPSLVAIGKDPRNGKDGSVVFDKELTMAVDDHQKASFRDIIQIPSVREGERIAKIAPPTRGTLGKNIFSETIQAKSGTPAKVRAGKNVIFKNADSSFYSKIDGQLSFDERSLQVQPLYEVAGDLDLRTGNLDFVGSIVIRGNVPSGYTVNALGDVTIYGLVEAAEITAGGSIHISEGVAGLGKANIQAALDVRVGYINQSEVGAGQDLFVENSILHSHCVAKRNIHCQRGNIIGGTISAGSTVVAKDIGNHMSTPTGVYLGVNKKVEEKQAKFEKIKIEKQQEKQKLQLIGEKLEQKKQLSGELPSKDRITLLRQKNSLLSVEEELEILEEDLETISSTIGDLQGAYVKVSGTLYANVDLGFGKYQHKVMTPHKHVHALIDDGEIVIRPNF